MVTSRSGPRPAATCRCGHSTSQHEHYRRGSDCGVCGASICPRFRPQHGGTLDRLRAMISRRSG